MSWSSKNGMWTAFEVLQVLDLWKTFSISTSLGFCSNCVELYPTFDHGCRLFKISRKHSIVISTRSKRERCEMNIWNKQIILPVSKSFPSWRWSEQWSLGFRIIYDDKAESCFHESRVFNFFHNSLKTWGSTKTITILSAGLSPIFAIFSSSSDAILELSIPSAFDGALEATNNRAEITIVDIHSPSKRTKEIYFFSARRLKAIDCASVSRKERRKYVPASGLTPKQSKETTDFQRFFSCRFIAGRKREDSSSQTLRSCLWRWRNIEIYEISYANKYCPCHVPYQES